VRVFPFANLFLGGGSEEKHLPRQIGKLSTLEGEKERWGRENSFSNLIKKKKPSNEKDKRILRFFYAGREVSVLLTEDPTSLIGEKRDAPLVK